MKELIVGKKDDGKLLYHNFSAYPVVLISGQTGSGKSNLIHSFILGLLKKYNSNELKLFLVDCKQIEFGDYKNNSYLFTPVKTCMQNDGQLFDKLFEEINKRKKNRTNKPYIFVAIDEFSDLAIQFLSQLEKLVEEISNFGTKIGIGLAMSTSRPSRDVVTDKIDKLVTTRIGFEFASDTDSQVILYQKGHFGLKKGEGFYLKNFSANPIHFQSAPIVESEVEKIASK